MVKKIIKRIKTRKIMKIVKEYANEVKKNYDIEAVILFGSYAKGTSHKDSDIDVAIVTDNITTNIFEEELKLVKLRRNIDTRIEPHLIIVEDYKSGCHPLVHEINDTGIKIA